MELKQTSCEEYKIDEATHQGYGGSQTSGEISQRTGAELRI